MLLLQRNRLTPIVAHQEYRVQRWIFEFRKFSKSKPRPKKIFARSVVSPVHVEAILKFGSIFYGIPYTSVHAIGRKLGRGVATALST